MVVITGATGLLGSHIADRFVAAGIPVRCLVRSAAQVSSAPGHEVFVGNVLEPESLAAAFQGATTVIHAAAQVKFRKKDRQELLDVNVKGTANVVDACLRNSVKRLVHISSVAALGKPGSGVVDETVRWLKNGVRSAYAESKHAAELEVFRGQEEGLSTVTINPSVILGTSDISRSSSRIFGYIWNNSRFYTDGSLNYVDVRDVAEIAFRLHSMNTEGERFIASAGSVTYKAFLSEVARLMDKPAPRFRLSARLLKVLARLEQVRSFVTGSDPLITPETARLARLATRYDSSKLVNLLNFRYRDLGESLAWCCNWYKKELSSK